jgi:hypothetical protein
MSKDIVNKMSKPLSIFFKTFDNTFANQGNALANCYLQSFSPILYNKACDLVISQNTFFPHVPPSTVTSVGALYGYIEGTQGRGANMLCSLGWIPGFTSNSVTYDSTNPISGIHKISIPNFGNITLNAFQWLQSPVEDPETVGGVFSGLHCAKVNNSMAVGHYCQYGEFESSIQTSNLIAVLSKFTTYASNNPAILICYLALKTTDVIQQLLSFPNLQMYPASGLPTSTTMSFSGATGNSVVLGGYFIFTQGLTISTSIVPTMTPNTLPISPEPFGLIINIENIQTQDSSDNTTITNAIGNTTGISGYTVTTVL